MADQQSPSSSDGHPDKACPAEETVFAPEKHFKLIISRYYVGLYVKCPAAHELSLHHLLSSVSLLE